MTRDIICLTLEDMCDRITVADAPSKDTIVIPHFDLWVTEEENIINTSFDYDYESQVLEITHRNIAYARVVIGETKFDPLVNEYYLDQQVLEEKISNKITKEYFEHLKDAEFVESCAWAFLFINDYIATYEDPFDVEEKYVKVHKPGIQGLRSQPVTRLCKCYTLKNVNKVKKRKFKIHCNAWGVRGHYRHYKNGKVIFIKGYVKGKDKANYQGKEYKLF